MTDLVTELGLAQSTVSAHLACLRDCGLVTSRPVGRASMFRLACPQLLDLLSAAEGVLAETGNAVALCPAYGLAAGRGRSPATRPPTTAGGTEALVNEPKGAAAGTSLPLAVRVQAAGESEDSRTNGSVAVAPQGGRVQDAGWLRAARQARLLAWASLAWMCAEGAVGLWQGVRQRVDRADRMGPGQCGRRPRQRHRDMAIHRVTDPVRDR